MVTQTLCLEIKQGYKQKKVFVVAQSPTESATRDFWKMIFDMKCGVIVNLNTVEEIGQVILPP